jgi:hypothetical protein
MTGMVRIAPVRDAQRGSVVETLPGIATPASASLTLIIGRGLMRLGGESEAVVGALTVTTASLGAGITVSSISGPGNNHRHHTIVVHTGVMTPRDKTVRQSVTLPLKVASQVRSMAKRQRLSASRMLIELLEEGIEAKKQKEKAFFELAEHFRTATDPKEVERLGEKLGQIVFGR